MSRGQEAPRDREKQLAVVRVDEIEMMDQFVGECVPGAVHHLNPEAINGSRLGNLECCHRRLCDRVMRRSRGQVHGRKVEDERAVRVVQEDAGTGGFERRRSVAG